MKHLTPNFKQHLSESVTTLATCWKIIRRDKKILGFTDHDVSLNIDDTHYEAIAGFSPSTVENKSDMSTDNLDIEGQILSSYITVEDLLAGLYDYAEVTVFLVNYTEPGDGKLLLKRGHVGEVTISKNMFRAEIRGLTQHLGQTMGEVYSPTCRAHLCDKKCKIDIHTVTISASVTKTINQKQFIASTLKQSNNWFSGGTLNWKTGLNADVSMEVKTFNESRITLSLPMNKPIQVGDQFTVIAGCDKTVHCCKYKFDNMINFRGEPDVPGIDKILETP